MKTTTNKTYRVSWTIDIEAKSEIEAAEKALSIQRNPESIATVFDVSADGKTKQIDLTELQSR